MAKFQIALCILLVALGAQAFVWDLDWDLDWNLDDTKAKWDAKLEEIKEALAEKENWLNEAKEKAEALVREWLDETEQKIQDTIEALLAKKEELEATAADFKGCATDSLPDVTGLAEEIRSNVRSCVQEATADVGHDYVAVKAAIKDLGATVTAIVASGQNCISDHDSRLGAVKCLVELARSDVADVVAGWNDLVLRVGELLGDLANIRDTVKSCAADSAIEALAEHVNASLAGLRECIDAAKTS